MTLGASVLAAALMLGYLLVRLLDGGHYLVATRDLAAGQPLEPSDFSVVTLKLPTGSRYLGGLAEGQVLGHSLQKGQLLNLADITQADDSSLVHLAVTPTGPIASDVRVGSTVSLWFIPKVALLSTGKQASASGGLIAQGLQVLQISKSSDSFGSSKTQLEIEVNQTSVASILALQSAAGDISVVAQR